MPPARGKRGRDPVATPDAANKLVKRTSAHWDANRPAASEDRISPAVSQGVQSKHVALLRGINVGTAKPVPMAKLALVFERLGYSNVKTVLRSGNVVFEAEGAPGAGAAAAVEAAVHAATGVQASVLLVSGGRFAAIAEANPLVEVATDGSKSFVSFVERIPGDLERPGRADLSPEALHVGDHAIYQWMPHGFLKTAVPKSFWKQFDGPVTTRNWNTVHKILDLLR